MLIEQMTQYESENRPSPKKILEDLITIEKLVKFPSQISYYLQS